MKLNQLFIVLSIQNAEVAERVEMKMQDFLQFEFAQINFSDRIAICLVVNLLTQRTQFCKCSNQINLRQYTKTRETQLQNSTDKKKPESYSIKIHFILPHNQFVRQFLGCVGISEPMGQHLDQQLVMPLLHPDQDPRMQT